MARAILTGDYELTIDVKSRLLIPSELRKSLTPENDGNSFYIVIGVNRKPWLYTEKYYETSVLKLEENLLPDPEAVAFGHLYYAMASRVEIDNQGRILIPEKTLRRTEIGRDVTLACVNDHLELWNRAEWNEQINTNLQRLSQLYASARQASSQPKSEKQS